MPGIGDRAVLPFRCVVAMPMILLLLLLPRGLSPVSGATHTLRLMFRLMPNLLLLSYVAGRGRGSRA